MPKGITTKVSRQKRREIIQASPATQPGAQLGHRFATSAEAAEAGREGGKRTGLNKEYMRAIAAKGGRTRAENYRRKQAALGIPVLPGHRKQTPDE